MKYQLKEAVEAFQNTSGDYQPLIGGILQPAIRKADFEAFYTPVVKATAPPAQPVTSTVIEEVPVVSTVMEDPKTPTFLGMTGPEWEAFMFGVKDGFKFWKRTHIYYSDVDKLDISPGLKQSIKDEWHYYEVGSDLPEDIALLGALVYLVISGRAEEALRAAMMYFGIAM